MTPATRMWSTWLRWPRDVERFAPTIAVAPDPSDLGEAERWGEMRPLVDYIAALHRDGTVTTRFRLVTVLHGEGNLGVWREWAADFDPRISRRSIVRIRAVGPDGREQPVRRWVERLGAERRVLRVSFGNLVPGTRLDFEERRDQFVPYALAPGLWDQAYLAGPMPIRRTRVTFAIAKPFEAGFAMHHGAPLPSAVVRDGYRVSTWDVRDHPPVALGGARGHLRDLVPWVDASTLTSWEPVAAFLRADLAHEEATDLARDLARRLIGAKETERERAALVYDFVANHVEDGRAEGDHQPAVRPAARVLEDLQGDCKDKAALAVAMLAELGIEARVAVILTAHHGRTPFLPGPRFDHALVRARVDGEHVWMDLVHGPPALGPLPPECRDLPALLLDGTLDRTPG